MKRISVIKGNIESEILVSKGENLYEELAKKGFIDSAPCGGRGKCGKCKIEIIENATPSTESDVEHLTPKEIERGFRLACKIIVSEDLSIRVFDNTKDFGGIVVLIEKSDIEDAFFALDIGTTTLEGVIIDAVSKEKIIKSVKLNPQKAFGADVFSRLNFSLESEENRLLLKESVISEINMMLENMCTEIGIDSTNISNMAISANTTMIHMLLGEKVDKLAFAPFETDFLAPNDFIGRDIGLRCENAKVHISPAASSFVGGDITAGAVSLGLEEEKHTTLFMDLGTNGEMIFARQGRFAACSVAAGPAFEGAEIECGMSALSGAICKIGYDEDIVFETIDEKSPKGICGSGLIDIMAVLLKLGLIDETGKLSMVSEIPNIQRRLRKIDDEDCIVLFEDEKKSVYLTQKDIRNFQLAKAAIRTGIDMLIEKHEVNPSDIDTIYIAGGFGSHLQVENLFRCGILPFKHENIEVVGNTSLKGSVMSVICEEAKIRIYNFSNKIEVFLLSKHPDFQNQFIENMIFEQNI